MLLLLQGLSPNLSIFIDDTREWLVKPPGVAVAMEKVLTVEGHVLITVGTLSLNSRLILIKKQDIGRLEREERERDRDMERESL